ncbi:TetR/AcrR family transcriptional regulator [Mycolicibacterium sp. Dal123E01]|uniref:TetR/AcrR family transcriptional regulator n=1 Tax=Mycolicibacterium sp. Dal123E01 TaxID=3457578 RepID=UPI00403EB5BF
MTGAMRDDERELPTEQRLLLAAERLFAEKGVDAVSLRAINAAAGTNVASLHYHYGSKDALLAALIEERSREIHMRRTRLLEALEGAKTITARGLAEAFAIPVAELSEAGGQGWIRFIANMIDSGHPALDIVTQGFFDHGTRFRALVSRLHPDWSSGTVVFRLSQAMSLTFRVLGNTDAVRATVAAGGVDMDGAQVLHELLDLLTVHLSDRKPTTGTHRK